MDTHILNDCWSGDHFSILHIDRLQFTLRHVTSSLFRNTRNPDTILEHQRYGRFELVLDNRTGSSIYYHSFKVLYDGMSVGRLHSASKFGRPEVQFDFDKQVFYCRNFDWWHEIYQCFLNDLGLLPGNINYVEIALDSTMDFLQAYSYYYSHSTNCIFSSEPRYKPTRKIRVDILNNGTAFNIWGNCNMISIYEKTSHEEHFIQDFFTRNGFDSNKVYRLESRLSWNYLKSLINKKHLVINAETLKDRELLTTLFELSVRHKIAFYDLNQKKYSAQRNIKFVRVSLLDGLDLTKCKLMTFNLPGQEYHYKTENIDADIMRKTYYQYLKTGNKNYFNMIRTCAEAASFTNEQVLSFLHRLNQHYKGSLTTEIRRRMNDSINHYSYHQKVGMIAAFYHRVRKKWKSVWSG